jgi:hypothetical protein
MPDGEQTPELAGDTTDRVHSHSVFAIRADIPDPQPADFLTRKKPLKPPADSPTLNFPTLRIPPPSYEHTHPHKRAQTPPPASVSAPAPRYRAKLRMKLHEVSKLIHYLCHGTETGRRAGLGWTGLG